MPYDDRGLMNETNRNIILDTLPENGTMLEYGIGFTSIWFLENMKEGQNLISIEHVPEWTEKILEMADEKELSDKHTILLSNPPPKFLLPVEGKKEPVIVDPYSTPLEELAVAMSDYINIPGTDFGEIDTFLIDGIARASCLAVVSKTCQPDAAIFLHDWETRREWYDWIVPVFSKVEEPTPNLLRLYV
jgi:hypothetical protein